MRVLLVCHGYPPFGVAGVERLSQQSAEALAGRGHDVTVLTRRPTPAPPTFQLVSEQRGGVTVVTIAGAGATHGEFPGHEAELELAFERTLAEQLPDIVLLSHLLHHSPGYVDIAHRWRIPVVVELHDFFFACPRAHLDRRSGERCDGPRGGLSCAVHCFDWEEQDSAVARWSLRAHTFRHALKAADVVLCPSRFVADWFAPLRGDATPIEVLGNGVPASLRRSVPRGSSDPAVPLHIASIGVATPHKGFHVAVEALRRASLPAARYTIFGATTASYDSLLRDAAEAVPGLDLRLFGGFEPRQLPALLADVDLLLVPSLVEETYSIAAREALACGIPVIASRLGALPSAVRDGENGLLFEPGDASGLAALLHRLHHDRPLIDRLAAGIRRDDAITVDERTDALERLLADAVAAGAAAASAGDHELRLLRDALATALR